ncbi:predicted protein [Uncinocarpus reesii 1704]|uniref:Uncharacterized protein n=1 Tax=Uncinocarpus reesii (strain UAMH 1704) TaxID=336963 RepID=C4K018_UNCRE|nr:uncharacterized protein UREG_07769 [Uncinocarpus reesii 1704]EEP82904.1 predicted protein [Uncinocarpus reesii 1704]
MQSLRSWIDLDDSDIPGNGHASIEPQNIPNTGGCLASGTSVKRDARAVSGGAHRLRLDRKTLRWCLGAPAASSDSRFEHLAKGGCGDPIGEDEMRLAAQSERKARQCLKTVPQRRLEAAITTASPRTLFH